MIISSDYDVSLDRKARGQMVRTTSSIAEDVTSDVQILPDDESLHSTELEGPQRVLDTETVLAGILTDLVEVPLNELLLLDELDVGKRFRCKFNSLCRCKLPGLRA